MPIGIPNNLCFSLYLPHPDEDGFLLESGPFQGFFLMSSKEFFLAPVTCTWRLYSELMYFCEAGILWNIFILAMKEQHHFFFTLGSRVTFRIKYKDRTDTPRSWGHNDYIVIMYKSVSCHLTLVASLPKKDWLKAACSQRETQSAGRRTSAGANSQNKLETTGSDSGSRRVYHGMDFYILCFYIILLV